MCEGGAPHPATVTVRITARADDKMLGHETMLEANAQRSTSNAQCRNSDV
jgi:hypothetical protein